MIVDAGKLRNQIGNVLRVLCATLALLSLLLLPGNALARDRGFDVTLPEGWVVEQYPDGVEARSADTPPSTLRVETSLYRQGMSDGEELTTELRNEVLRVGDDIKINDGPPYESDDGQRAGSQFETQFPIDGVEHRGWFVVIDRPAENRMVVFSFWAPAAEFDAKADLVIRSLESLKLGTMVSEEDASPAEPATPPASVSKAPAEATVDQPVKPDPTGHVTGPAPLHQCDLEAADPNDPDRVASMSNTDDFGLPQNAKAAVNACSAAVDEWPNEARFKIYLAKSLDAQATGGNSADSEQKRKGIALIEAASKLGYRHADLMLGMAALDGGYLDAGSNIGHTAERLLLQASQNGHTRAKAFYAMLLEGSRGNLAQIDYEKAARLFLEALREQDDAAREAILVYPESRSPQTMAAIQNILAGQGLYRGTVDGKFGKNTRAAIKAYMVR